MIKDAKQYAATSGWGWARWRGNDLKPYGGTAYLRQNVLPVTNLSKQMTWSLPDPWI
jgi:hypothetical protein